MKAVSEASGNECNSALPGSQTTISFWLLPTKEDSFSRFERRMGGPLAWIPSALNTTKISRLIIQSRLNYLFLQQLKK